jgi:ketosteroid isomerase-like protein
MAQADRVTLARRAYEAYETGDRDLIESLLAEEFVFFAPPDPGIDRVEYFERCWPNAEQIDGYEFPRLEETDAGEVLVTYEATRADGSRFRNTEILTFEGDRITKVEVYFGWDL